MYASLIARSHIHCTTMCIATVGCSAFQFDDITGVCGLGNKLSLQTLDSTDDSRPLMNIAINPVGKT